MERVRIDDAENFYGPAAVTRSLSRALGTTELAVNYYELDPGDALSYGYHRHPEQEEVFIVESGTVTFETESSPVEVTAGEVVRFAPGEFQHGTNEGTDRVRVLALGAPQEASETDLRRTCPDCGGRTPHTIEMAPDRDAIVTRCEDCGALTGRFVHGEVDLEPT